MTEPSTPGTCTLTVTVSDGIDTTTLTQGFTVRDPDDSAPPEVKLVLSAEHPDHDSVEITAPTAVTGDVTGSDVGQENPGQSDVPPASSSTAF